MITSEFVIAVHDEILYQTQVGRAGVHLDRLESVLGRVEQLFITDNLIISLKLLLGMELPYLKVMLLLMATSAQH